MTAKKALLWIGTARVALELIERQKMKNVPLGPGPIGAIPQAIEQSVIQFKFNRIERAVNVAFVATALFVLGG